LGKYCKTDINTRLLCKGRKKKDVLPLKAILFVVVPGLLVDMVLSWLEAEANVADSTPATVNPQVNPVEIPSSNNNPSQTKNGEYFGRI
jgi:hypothetical protein